MSFVPTAITRGDVVEHGRIGSIAVTEARHLRGMELFLHAHPAPCLTYVVSGAFEERADDLRHRCTPGDVVLKPTDAAHTNVYGSSGAHSFVVEIPDHICGAFEDRGDPLSRCLVFEEGPVPKLMARIYCEQADADNLSGFVVEELLHRLIAALASGKERTGRRTDPAPTSSAPPWLREVYDRVRAEFRRKPSLAELAGEAGVHPDHLSRSFHRHYGSTIGQMVRRWRVEAAAHHVREGNEPLASIAYRTGFSDQPHMTRQMKLYLGVTPGRLRERG